MPSYCAMEVPSLISLSIIAWTRCSAASAGTFFIGARSVFPFSRTAAAPKVPTPPVVWAMPVGEGLALRGCF